MKTYHEMANSALRRIEKHKEIHQKRKQRIRRITVPTLCFCFAAVLGIIIWKSEVSPRISLSQPMPSSGIAGTDFGDITSSKEPSQFSETENVIVINQLESIISDHARADIAVDLSPDDFVKMSDSELNTYYGIDIFPSVPSDLTNWDTADDFSGYGIYRREKGTGEVYWDQTVLNYSNSDFTRDINIEITKDHLPFVCFAVDKTEYQKSRINGTDIYIGISVEGIYQAQFMHNNVGFIFTGKGLSQEEFVAVIQSIVEQ